MNKKAKLAKLCLLLTTIIWGFGFVVVKNTVDSVPPILLIALRFSIAAFALAIVFAFHLKEINLAYVKRGCILGIILFIAYSLQTIGITMTTPGKNAFLTAVYCIFVPFLHWVFEKRRPELQHFIAAPLCVVGIGLVSLNENLSINTGDLLTLAGGIFFAIHIVLVSRCTKSDHGNPILYTIIQFLTAAILSWTVSLIFEEFPPGFTNDAIYSILFLGVFATAVGLLFQTIGQKYTHPAVASIILSLESVFGVLFSVAFYGEILHVKTIIGFAVIFASIIISETAQSRSRLAKEKRELSLTE